MAKPEKREEARRLRKEKGLSVNKIAEILGVSKNSVSRWVRDVPLTDDQRHQLMENSKSYGAQHQGSIANRVKHRKIREGYQQAGRKKAREGDPLHLTGCMLYWAEGTKDRNECRFTNSDLDMVVTFLRFLRQSLKIESTRLQIRISVYLDNGLTIDEIEEYWLTNLELPPSCVLPSDTKIPKSSQQKGRKLLYGTCEARVKAGTQYVQHIYGAIQEYAGIDKPEWLD